MKYSKGIDYCTLVPDKLIEYDLSGCCYLHDIDYASKSKSKFKSDVDFYK